MVKRLLIGAVRGYQRAISPLKRAPTCRFIPSCSDYMADAIGQRGVLVGLAKGVWRILRCQPFGGHGYDPVAPRALSDGERQH